MTRGPRRASSRPQRVGSDEGLTTAHPAPRAEPAEPAEPADPPSVAARRAGVEQTTDDTDEGWGERGEDDASARWLRENRPPHWS